MAVNADFHGEFLQPEENSEEEMRERSDLDTSVRMYYSCK